MMAGAGAKRFAASLIVALPLLASALVACGEKGETGPGDSERTVRLTARYSKFEPAEFTFPAGTTVRFVITNEDPIEHEFILGDRAHQDHIENTAHPVHDGSVPGEITIRAGETAETTYTFEEPGVVLIGCHEPGHWDYGMRGEVTVTA